MVVLVVRKPLSSQPVTVLTDPSVGEKGVADAADEEAIDETGWDVG